MWVLIACFSMRTCFAIWYPSTPNQPQMTLPAPQCQRLAIGATTLRKFSEHLPHGLKITIHPETNKFRSVHKTSITTQVANVPSSLGVKGSLLKPAVFDSDESTNALFLLSLSFLLHCHGDIGLCLEKGLQLRLRGNHEPVPLHLGPTGALRFPLQQFTELQLTALQRAQSEDLGTSPPEFEVLKLNEQCMKPPEPDKTPDVPTSTSPGLSACHAEHRPEAQPTCCTGDFEPGRQGLDSIDPSATGRAHASSVPVRTPLGNHHGSTIPTPGSGAPDREHVRRGAPPRDQDGQGRDESSRRTFGQLHRDQRSGTTLGRIPQRRVQKETLVRTQRCDQIDSLPGIEMLTGPRPRCRCGLQVKIHLSTEANHEEEIYFRCPKCPGQQCEFKQWTPCQPLKDVTSWKYRQQPGEKPKSYAEALEGMVQEICPHSSTHRKGSNAFLTKVTCRYCNKVIRQEKKAVVTETASHSSPSETLPRPSQLQRQHHLRQG